MRIRSFLALIVAIVSIPIFLAATLALVKIRQDERDAGNSSSAAYHDVGI